jgi:hypothetical protein
MTLETFLENAWTEHGERPQAVADRLGASIDLLQTSELAGAAAALAGRNDFAAALRAYEAAQRHADCRRARRRFARSRSAAQRCVDVCALNAAPPLEQFFAHAVLAIAHRAAGDRAGYDASRGHALAAWADMPSDEARSCEARAQRARRLAAATASRAARDRSA